jgi:cytochrome b561
MTTPKGFSRTQIVAHWATALLVIPIWVFHDGIVNAMRALRQGQVPASSDALVTLFHVWGGIVVLVFAFWRIDLRYTNGVPAAPPNESTFLRRAASVTHVTLYGLLIYFPLTGILGYFGNIEIANQLHGLAQLPILVLVVLHGLAALYHHFILKTDVLRRMIKPL